MLALAGKPAASEVRQAFKRAMLLWFIPYFLFFSFWDSGNIEFKIHALMPLLLIAVTSLDGLKPFAAKSLGVLLAGALLLGNLFFGIRPLADASENTNLQVALAIQKATPAQAQILLTGNFQGYGYGKIYLPYFALRDVAILDWLLGKGQSLADILARLKAKAASGRPLYALGEIAERGPAMRSLLDFHHVRESETSRFYSGMSFTPAVRLPGGYRLYRVEFAAP